MNAGLFEVLIKALLAIAVFTSVPTRYFVGGTEVTQTFWNGMPDSLNYMTGEFNYDTLVIKQRHLPFTHYLDSVSTPGEYVLRKRSSEAIAEFERAFAEASKTFREQSLLASVGDLAPQISLVRYKDESIVEDFIAPGQCYLLSFWATWCGNCLQELQPEYIPRIAGLFQENPDFHFVPICIDATSDDLQKFFTSNQGTRWNYLSELTCLDTDRKANEKYGESGIMPLNVVIGRDGRIRYIHSGTIKTLSQQKSLFEAIKSGL